MQVFEMRDEPSLRTRKNELYDALATTHGGYWRHDFTDHAYLYNLYFPPESFFDLLKRNIHDLVSNYPVAQPTLAGWVGKLIDQPPERIVVGNGAAELIKILSASVARKLIVPVPSFNEYADAAPAPGIVEEFPLDASNFELDVDQFAAAALKCEADVAVVVTPNNPTSLSVPKADLIRLAGKLADHDCMLVVDESFIDFSSRCEQETLARDIADYPNLAIIKSMSKAYGICGLRIGYLLTANAAFADRIRAGLHIWNLNGFAEIFLETGTEYKDDFAASCVRVRADRDAFYESLSSITDITVYKPDANFIFCRLADCSISGPDLARRLFLDHDIYIKHCAGKTMPNADQYIRIASRTPAENAVFIDALKAILENVNQPENAQQSATEPNAIRL
jgi:histidinol-phosphate/aromatic aminotransferase/cobyric acid decarboxylase-like protein